MKKISTLFLLCFIYSAGFSQFYIDEDFSSFTAPVVPPISSGWKNVDSLNTPASDSIWRFDNLGARNLNSPFSNNVAIMDSDEYGGGQTQFCYLESPVFDASLATTVVLEFDHVFRYYGFGTPMDTAYLEVFDGTFWRVDTIYTQSTDPANVGNETPIKATLDISQYVAGVSNAQIRFGYKGSWAYYWMIDNIQVFQPLPDDAGVISVDSLSTGCSLTANETVAMSVFNAGSTVLTAIPVNYRVNGGTIVSEVFNTTLQPGATGIYSFTAKADFSVAGTYTVEAFTSIRGDANQANDTAIGIAQHVPSIASYPYTQGFETGNGGWTTSGTNSSWAIGTPAGAVIATAAGGTQAAVTNLSGDYNNNEVSYLESPCLDFSSFTADPILYFSHTYITEACCDEGWIEYSTNAGATWTKLIDNGGAREWYNDLNNIWWDGTSSGGPGVWVNAENVLLGLAGQAQVKLRFVFSSDFSVVQEGFGVDNIRIADPPAADAGIVSMVRPESGCALGASDSVEVRIINAGLNPISNFPVSYEFNGGTAVNATFTNTINPGDTANYVFNSSINLSAFGAYTVKAYTGLTADANPLNDTINKNVTNIPVISVLPYTEGFENGPGGWVTYGVSNSWAIGTPAGAVITTAAAGTQAAVTNLTGQYNNSEVSYIESPCLDLSSLTVDPILSFSLTFETESGFDDGWVEFSTNGGVSWTKLLDNGGALEWYNNTATQVWEGNSSGGAGVWVTAENRLTGLGGQASVKIRFAFSSDGSVTREGFAIDNIRIAEPAADDVSLVALVEPGSSCDLGTADSVRVLVANVGSLPQSNFPLAYEFNGTAAVVDTFRQVLNAGDTALFTFATGVVNVGTPNTTYSFKSYTKLAADGNPTNDTNTTSVSNDLKVAPYTENFDSFTINGATLSNGWNRSSSSANTAFPYRWQVNAGQTGSGATGPSGDNTTGTTNYIYTEASSGATGDTAFLTSPCIDPSNLSSVELEFFYHMLGAQINTLYIGVQSSAGFTLVDSIVGAQQAAIADPFLQRNINITPFIGSGNINVVFYSLSLGCCAGDIALDDVRIYEPSAVDAEIVSIDSPVTSCPLGTSESVTITVNNAGLSTLNSVPVNMVFNGGTVVTDTIRTPILPGNTEVFTFATTVNMAAAGVYTFDVYTSAPGDGDLTNDSIIGYTAANSLTTVPSVTNFDNFTAGTGFNFDNSVFIDGWVATPSGNSDYAWRVATGPTGSGGTGPNADHTTGSGNYIFTEASVGITGDAALVTSSCFDINNTIQPTLVYWYHMFGNNITSLDVQIDTGGVWTTIRTITGAQQAANADPFLSDTVNLNNFKSSGLSSIRFQVLRGAGLSGDVAVDDVSILSLPVGISENDVVANNISIFPNPSSGVFNINLLAQNETLNLEVFDINGKSIREAIISANQTQFNLDLSDVAKGVYFLRLNNEKVNSTQKLIVK